MAVNISDMIQSQGSSPSPTGGPFAGAPGSRRRTKTRTLSQSKKMFQQDLLQKEFGDSLTQRIPGSREYRRFTGIGQPREAIVDPEGVEEYYDQWTQDLEKRIEAARVPDRGRTEILKQGRENVFAQAKRLREDRRYGIDPDRYYGESVSSGGTPRRTAYFDVRKSLIRNAQIKKSQDEQRMTRESREKERAYIGGRRSAGRAGGTRMSLLSSLGQEGGRYTGL